MYGFKLISICILNMDVNFSLLRMKNFVFYINFVYRIIIFLNYVNCIRNLNYIIRIDE